MRRLSKAWIFVSHSTNDIENVRRLRDALEARGAEPILFFLKAIDAHEELRALLRREIDARSHFLLCDSEASRQSSWVREEQAYVRSLLGKRVTTLALYADWQEQEACIDTMLKTATVFISYSPEDEGRMRPFADLLADYDFAVWTQDQVLAGQNWRSTIEAALLKAAEDGYLLAFLSTASLQSAWAAHEIAAFERLAGSGGRLIWVELEPVDHLLPPQLRTIQRLRFFMHNDTKNRQMLLDTVDMR